MNTLCPECNRRFASYESLRQHLDNSLVHNRPSPQIVAWQRSLPPLARIANTPRSQQGAGTQAQRHRQRRQHPQPEASQSPPNSQLPTRQYPKYERIRGTQWCIRFEPVPLTGSREHDDNWCCVLCNRNFATSRALVQHMTNASNHLSALDGDGEWLTVLERLWRERIIAPLAAIHHLRDNTDPPAPSSSSGRSFDQWGPWDPWEHREGPTNHSHEAIWRMFRGMQNLDELEEDLAANQGSTLPMELFEQWDLNHSNDQFQGGMIMINSQNVRAMEVNPEEVLESYLEPSPSDLEPLTHQIGRLAGPRRSPHAASITAQRGSSVSISANPVSRASTPDSLPSPEEVHDVAEDLPIQEQARQLREQVTGLKIQLLQLKQILKKEKAARQCSMCYERENDTITECGHQFCNQCITRWQRQRNRESMRSAPCPMCRAPLGTPIKVYTAARD